MNSSRELTEEKVNPDPFIQFGIWYKEHLAAGIAIPESFSLATSTSDGHVSVRTVLLKEHGNDGFVFFTNYNSRKGSQISENPKVAMLFYWSESGRQVRIEGVVSKISPKESDSYFKTRPRESQLSAWTSEQSSVVPHRLHLEERYQYYNEKYAGGEVERPPHWGGFRITPFWFEFWKSDEVRLHDRITYSKDRDVWILKRLAP
jgi:pyridoxamine 5'-phosphate oxidase